MKVIESINFALAKYEYEHCGKLPIKIFISNILFDIFETEMCLNFNRVCGRTWEYEFRGIPVIEYISDIPEYYFADYHGEFWDFK